MTCTSGNRGPGTVTGMTTIERRVRVERPLSRVFTYLSDFTTTNEWDPGTVETVRTGGDGGVGTTYHNTSRFLGRTTSLTYVVERLEPDRLVALRGENKTVLAHDTMTLRAVDRGTEVTYRAEFALKGLARFAAPLLAPAFKKPARGPRAPLTAVVSARTARPRQRRRRRREALRELAGGCRFAARSGAPAGAPP